jgi:hypothetical protein
MNKLWVLVLASAAVGHALEAKEAVDMRTSSEIEHSIFGTGTHFPMTYDSADVLPMIEKTGFKWIRDHVLWHVVEKEKGVFEIPAEHRAWIDEAHARGINICMPLAYFNPLYGHEDWPAHCEAYARYCVFMVGELKDKVQVWEIWNEPSGFFRNRSSFGGSWNAKEGAATPWLDKFMDMLIVAARAVREAHPDVTITVGDSYPVIHHMLDMLKDRGATDLLDGIVSHPYNRRVPPELAPYGGPNMDARDGVVVIDKDHSFASAIRRIREKMRDVGMKTTDIYITEFGMPTHLTTREYSADLNMGHNLETQAKYLARSTILQAALDVKLSIQYDFMDNAAKSPNPERNFGLIYHRDVGSGKKPSWHVMRRICSLLAGVRVWEPDWAVTVDPPGYLNNSKWPFTASYTTWDGERIEALNRVLAYVFRNEQTGELLLAAWNAVDPSFRAPLLTTITLGTELEVRDGIDLMTGEAFEVDSEAADGQTVLKDVVVPDYPVVIRMRPRSDD